MRDKVIIFIDKVAAKNKLQVAALDAQKLSALFFVYTLNHSADEFLHPRHEQIRLSKNPLIQCFQVLRKVRAHSRTIHHLEIYPGNVLSFYYLFLGKLFGLRTLCVERGDLVYFHSKGYHALTRWSMKLCYRYADIVWYRELFMKPVLQKLRAKKLFFIHNSVRIGDMPADDEDRPIDFLWLNRVVPERRPDWFVQALQKETFRHTSNALVGLIPGGPYPTEQKYLEQNRPENLSLNEFSPEAESYLRKSRFFVMAAEYIFANNALLEAMSVGVIPLISDQHGSSLIVDDGINGFIFPHSYEGLERAMTKAIALDKEAIKKMSRAARQKMIDDFSEENYISRIKELYRELENSN